MCDDLGLGRFHLILPVPACSKDIRIPEQSEAVFTELVEEQIGLQVNLAVTKMIGWGVSSL